MLDQNAVCNKRALCRVCQRRIGWRKQFCTKPAYHDDFGTTITAGAVVDFAFGSTYRSAARGLAMPSRHAGAGGAGGIRQLQHLS